MEYCNQLWGLHHKKDLNLLEWGRKDDSRTGEERLKEMWLFSLEKRNLWGDFIMTFQYLIVFIKKL